MEIIHIFWEQFLYTPLFNLLVWLYNTYANYNMGVAVIALTVLIRIVLLPFTLLEERRKNKKTELASELKKIQSDYGNDVVKQRIAIRQFLKRKHIRPWAKALSLIFQGLILIVMYYVFIGGIDSQHNLDILYPGIARPDFINTRFLWFDIGEHNLLMAAIVAGYVFAQTLIQQIASKYQKMSRQEQIFTIMFPAFTFLALALLPSVKSLFILTSLVFSSIISIPFILYRKSKEDKEVKKKKTVVKTPFTNQQSN